MNLYENFNTSIEKQPRAEGHDIFVVYVKSDDCGIVQDLDYAQRCAFVKATDSCADHVNIIDYITFVYCTVGARNEYSHWIIMVFLLIFACYLFSILGSTADMFLCPALTVISNALHMSENLAGVTILAFGNGSPDIFTSLADMEGETTLMISEAYGAAVFVIGAISGIIIVVQPFKIFPPTYIRDASFIVFICVYINYIMYDGTVNIYESTFIIVLYVIYILVVILDQIIVVQMSRDVQRKLDMVAAGMADSDLQQELQELKEQGVLELLGKKSHISLDIDDTKSADFIGVTPNTRLFTQFLESLNPIDKEEWEEAGIIGKFLIIIKAPPIAILLLTLPVVDYEKQIHGWSKLLNVLQIFITPAFMLIINQMWNKDVKGVSVFVIVAGVTIPLMILVFCTSRTDQPPRYHIAYAVANMIACIIVIQIIASEVVMILDTVGIAAKLTPSFLGCTILAWGNSVGDLISNITLAKQGYHKMGFAACFGGPLIIIILGFGLTFIHKCATSPEKLAYVRQGSMGSTCNLFLTLIVLLSAIGIACSKFQARRTIGLYMLAFYLLFLVYAVLGEFEIIHPYGTDHRDARVKMD
ncbi:mitochondrial sodium/calcium exchanger protein-like [Hermetia illucens]|uniref:mitochondrial sodium/calcium exchanger protein-like n=1 Tax=Hermetia illucens TaxID=343691 RepID=UPI0018CBF401|nr:mitochondrial sodium/calcium exchanger protein-like [Hermetia illucens]